ncbi:unnamed protein product [Urochloa humidicola]
MASAAVETLASFPIASPSRSLLRALPRRPAAAGGGALSIRISPVPPRGLGVALVHRPAGGGRQRRARRRPSRRLREWRGLLCRRWRPRRVCGVGGRWYQRQHHHERGRAAAAAAIV